MVKRGGLIALYKNVARDRRSRSRSPGTKTRKTAELSPLTLHSKACAVGRTQQAATDDTVGALWRHSKHDLTRLRRWENQRMLSS